MGARQKGSALATAVFLVPGIATAAAIRRIVQESPSQVEAYKQTYELLGVRLTQAREVVNA